METRAGYGLPSIRGACLQRADAGWVPPSGEEIKAALQLAGWSGLELSRRVNVDGRTVRRWTLDERDIPYAAWCVLCVEAGFGEIWK